MTGIFEGKRNTKPTQMCIRDSENMLENLNEVSISLDESVLELARRAFEDQATSYMEQLSNNLVTHK